MATKAGTPRKKSAQRSTQSQLNAKEWERVFSSMAALVFVTDKNLVITYINDPALKAMGYTREEVVGKMTCADLCKTPLCGTENCTIKNCWFDAVGGNAVFLNDYNRGNAELDAKK